MLLETRNSDTQELIIAWGEVELFPQVCVWCNAGLMTAKDGLTLYAAFHRSVGDNFHRICDICAEREDPQMFHAWTRLIGK